MRKAEAAVRKGKKNMETFMQKFERVAVKYAAYVEAKLAFSSNIKELKPGQEIVFGEPEEEAEQLLREMQTLNKIAQTLKEEAGGRCN